MKKQNLTHLIVVFFLFLIGFVIFTKTFQLEIFGDEWEAIWWTTATLQSTGHYNDRVDYKPYETAATLLNIVSGASSFDYNSTSVYVFSFLTRLLAACALYYFLIRRGITSKVSFAGALMFLITPVGIQATDWAKNFTSYISITFFLICLDSIYKLKSLRNILVFLITFSLSIYVNPIRSHGIIITTTFLLLFQILFNKLSKKYLFLIASIFCILFLFSKAMIFSNSNIFQSIIVPRLISIFWQTLSGDLQRIIDLFTLIGRGLLPQPSPAYFVLLAIILLFWKKHLFTGKYFLFLLLGHIPFLFLVFINGLNFLNTSTAIIGGYFSIFIISAFFIELLNKKTKEAFQTSLPFLLNITFIIVPWILGNTDITDSTHRYLIFPALSIPILVAFSLNSYISSGVNRVLQMPFKSNVLVLSIVWLLVMYFSSIKSEIDDMYNTHNKHNSKIIWQQITPHFDKVDFNNQRPLILFESDNAAMLQDTVMFGINYRLGFLYRIWNEDKLPIPLDGKETLKSMLTDGKASKRYIGKKHIFPKEDAFYFRINGNVVNKVDISELFIETQTK